MNRQEKKKSSGAVDITDEMLKYLGYKAKRTLLLIFNLSWHSDKLPSKRKEARIKPFLKKGRTKSKPES